MPLMHHLRRAALRIGLDVRRVGTTAPARLVRLLSEWRVDGVLDVGANQGQYGKQLRQFGYRGPICSFEPLPEMYGALARHVRGDSGWTAHNLALGADDGTICLNIAGNKGAASSSVLPMLPRHEKANPDARYVASISVPVRRLDTVWSDVVPAGSTAFLKLDVQGYEGTVLDGAEGCLESLIGIQLELSLVPLYDGAPSFREVLDRMEDLGMRLVYVEPGFSDPLTGELLQVDGIFTRRSAELFARLNSGAK